MKLFAKYRPVEGEIKKGDNFWIKNVKGKNSLFEKVEPHPEWKILEEDGLHLSAKKVGTELVMTVAITECTKVKLFLCSRDIQVGDKVLDKNGKEWETAELQKDFFDNKKQALESGLYKVIGEISPEATWVKEGDEFDEEDVQIKYHTIHECLCQKSLGYEDEACSHYSGGTNKYVDGCYRKEKLSTSYEIKVKGQCGHFH